MTDFFISYTHADREWAEWIAFVLEEERFTTIIQAWDFRPGSNFVLEMQRAAETAARTIIVLSPDYLASTMAAPEWASAFASDPLGLDRKLLPVMVVPCQPKGLLPTIVQIRLTGLPQDEARAALVAGINGARAKPSSRPSFPGNGSPHAAEKTFPGEVSARRVIPEIKREWTDVERRRFVKDGVEAIRLRFEANIRSARREEPRLDSDITQNSATDFSAELFLDGKSKCRCRIWLSNDMGGDSIGFQEGNTSGNAFNDILYPSSSGRPSFHASMAAFVHGNDRSFDTGNLTLEDAADYLWSRFIGPLSY